MDAAAATDDILRDDHGGAYQGMPSMCRSHPFLIVTKYRVTSERRNVTSGELEMTWKHSGLGFTPAALWPAMADNEGFRPRVVAGRQSLDTT